MIDTKKINRVKGILSARLGAEVPAAQPQNFTPPKFQKRKGDAVIYSNDNVNWFQTIDLSQPYVGSTDGFVSIGTVPGLAPISPWAVVETAAEVSKKQANIAIETQAAAQAATQTVAQADVSATNPEAVSLNGQHPPVETGKKGRNGNPKPENPELAAKREERKEKWANAAGVGVTPILQGMGTAMGAAQKATDSDTTKMVDTTYDSVASGLANSNTLVGQVAGTAMQFGKLAGDIVQELGGGTDQQTTTDKWMDSGLFSWNIGAINGFFGKESNKFGVDRAAIESVGSSYGNTTKDILDAASKANKKYGLFSSKERNRANKAAQATAAKQNLMGNIADTATDQRLAVQSMGEQAGLAYSMMTDGGYSQKYTYAAKQGGILEWEPDTRLEWEPQIELNWELPTFKEGGNIDINEELEWISEFKNGGKTEDSDIPEIEETTQKNVIPEGALHKNKHHMEHAEGLTKKGIPVIDDDGEQQAEIEHSEIIFTLEVTKKLEEYYKIFYSEESSNKEKEQAALDAGKLLVYQILENTEDRTGLIDSCKKGGSLTLKKSTDTLIEEVLEEMPTMVIIEEEEVKEKPKKKEGKLDKELMKEAIKEVLVDLLTK